MQFGYQAKSDRPVVADQVIINVSCNLSGLIIADTVTLMSGSTISGVIICRSLVEANGDIYGGNNYNKIWAFERIQLHPDIPSVVPFVTAGPDANAKYSMIREAIALEDETHWMDDAVRKNAAAIKSAAVELKLDWLSELVDDL